MELIKGMIVNKEKNQGTDMGIYTGSTTGTSRDNDVCSRYTPITWQVDRQCHKISASSFDNMCKQMLEQKDDMQATSTRTARSSSSPLTSPPTT